MRDYQWLVKGDRFVEYGSRPVVNPIRARIATTVKLSDLTSAQDRLVDVQAADEVSTAAETLGQNRAISISSARRVFAELTDASFRSGLRQAFEFTADCKDSRRCSCMKRLGVALQHLQFIAPFASLDGSRTLMVLNRSV